MGLETLRWKLAMVILLICFGTALSAWGEIRFDTLGFIMGIASCLMSALRWGLMQVRAFFIPLFQVRLLLLFFFFVPLKSILSCRL